MTLTLPFPNPCFCDRQTHTQLKHVRDTGQQVGPGVKGFSQVTLERVKWTYFSWSRSMNKLEIATACLHDCCVLSFLFWRKLVTLSAFNGPVLKSTVLKPFFALWNATFTGCQTSLWQNGNPSLESQSWNLVHVVIHQNGHFCTAWVERQMNQLNMKPAPMNLDMLLHTDTAH